MVTRKSKRRLDLEQGYETNAKQSCRTISQPFGGTEKSCEEQTSIIKECSVVCERIEVYWPPNDSQKKSVVHSDHPDLGVPYPVEPKVNVIFPGNAVENTQCIPLNDFCLPDAKPDPYEPKAFSYSFVSDSSINCASAQDKTFLASRFYKTQKYMNPLERKCLLPLKTSTLLSFDVKKRKVKTNREKLAKSKRAQNKKVLIKKSKLSKPSLVNELSKSSCKMDHPQVQRKFFTSRSSCSNENKVFTTALAWRKGMHIVKSGSSISVKNTSHSKNHIANFKSCPLLSGRPHQITKLKSIENIPKLHGKNVSPYKDDKSPKDWSAPQTESNSDVLTNDALSICYPVSEQVIMTDTLLTSPEIFSEDVPCSKIFSKEGATNYYPLFDSKASGKQRRNPIISSTPKTFKPIVIKVKQFIKETKDDGKEQMIIDAGQKEIGAKHCPTCNMVYTIAEAKDERMHAKYHEKFLSNLKFPGWKKEHVLGEFYDGRVIMITKEEKRSVLKKVEDVLDIVNRDLGFPDLGFPRKPNVTFLLFISSDKKVVGCLVAESINQASRVVFEVSNENVQYCIPSDQDETECKSDYLKGNWCSSTDTVKAVCGINRIWTAPSHRRQQIATRMVDCLRCNFLFGYVISNDELAFSDPSIDGREFATSYTGTPNFLVYK